MPAAPFGMATDSAGNLFIAADGLVLKMDTSGNVSTVAGPGSGGVTLGDAGPATKATLSLASGVAVDSAGNVYIADSGHNRIRKIGTDGTINTFAGPGSTNGILGDNGPALSATLASPADVAVDPAGNVYIADTGNSRVRRVAPDGTITTVAGNGKSSDSTGFTGDGGQATAAVIGEPAGVAVDSAGNLFIADRLHSTVRKVTPDGIIGTVAGGRPQVYSGDGGPGNLAGLYFPVKLATDRAGNLYIADQQNNRIRLVTPDGRIVTVAGNGSSNSSGDGGAALSAGVGGPQGVAVAPDGNVFIGERSLSPYSAKVRMLTATGQQVFPGPSIAASGVISASAFGGFSQIAIGGWVEIYGSYLASNSRLWTGNDFNGAAAPTMLDNTSVTIGGQPAYVDYISPGQVNVLAPGGIGTGPQQVVVKTPYGTSAAFTVTVNPQEPGLLVPSAFKDKGIGYVAATFPDGAYDLPPGAIAGVNSRLAQGGDTITLYGVGFGAVTPAIPPGQVVGQNNALVLPLQVKFGNQAANVNYAGLAPGLVGLYQFNVVVPNGPFGGLSLLYMTLGGVPLQQTPNIAVK
ncbi:MAG TPA: hypothetical protein VFA33_08925 [Bryobacteraceae bacterium]|nr:hypothetical protein [Bryobacteraceae bacterium]